MRFIALDLETANEDMTSICQIGMARFVEGALEGVLDSYIDPQARFAVRNVGIHGIDATTVSEAPAFQSIATRLSQCSPSAPTGQFELIA